QRVRNRSARALKAALLDAEPSSASPDPSARADLERLLSSLSEEELALFAYAFRDGFTQEEIADLMRTSRKTVGKRLAALSEKVGGWTRAADAAEPASLAVRV